MLQVIVSGKVENVTIWSLVAFHFPIASLVLMLSMTTLSTLIHLSYFAPKSVKQKYTLF